MGRSSEPGVSVVVPTCNEARTISALLPRIAAVGALVREVVVVDAGSVDDTVASVRGTLPAAKVVTQTRYGKGNALACGFAAATSDLIVTLDADGRADPAQIPAFVAALVQGADFATGSRFLPGGSAVGQSGLRRGRTALLAAVASAFFGTAQTDPAFPYHAFWSDQLPMLDLPAIGGPAAAGPAPWGDGLEIETVLGCRMAASGRRLVEIPAVERTPLAGPPVRRTAADDRRVLRALLTEHRRIRRDGRTPDTSDRVPIPERASAGSPASGFPVVRSPRRPPNER